MDPDGASSAALEDGTSLGALDQAISSGTLVPAGENVLNVFGPAVRLDAGGPCSGVKIGAKKFLTAAHCFSDSARTIKITNSLNGVFPSTSFTITKQLRHPSHKLGATGNEEVVSNGLYDVKIIEINEATDSIPIAKITPLAAAVGTRGLVSIGYGCDTQSTNDNQKQKATFDVVQGAASAHVHYISEASTPALCPGDSGGPLFRLVGNEWQVTGINSGTAVFARIENTAPWIASPTVNVFSGTGQFMNLASASSTAFPPANCAAMMGTGAVSSIAVQLDQCDGQAALYNGRHSVNWGLFASNTGTAGFQKIISFGNGNCLGVDGASSGDANVFAIECAPPGPISNLLKSQSWKFVDVGQVSTTSVGTPAIHAFNIVSELSGKCLSTRGSTVAAVNSDVRVSTCDSLRRDQKWVFTR